MGLGGISIWQLLIVLVIVVMIFGTKKLRNMGGDLGTAVKGFKKSVKEDPGSDAPLKSQVEEESDKDGEDVTEVAYDRILGGHYEHVKVVTHRGHSGWTRKVMYAPHLDLIISCSTTSTNSLVLGMKEKNETQMRM